MSTFISTLPEPMHSGLRGSSFPPARAWRLRIAAVLGCLGWWSVCGAGNTHLATATMVVPIAASGQVDPTLLKWKARTELR